MEGTMAEDELLTVAELAELLKVTPQTIYAWRAERHGPPAVKLNDRAIRFRRCDVDAWLEARSEPSVAS